MRTGTEEYERVRAVMAARIRALRLAKGLSQEQLADLAGCDRTYVGMLERQKGNPSLSILTAIASALGERLDELFADEDPSDTPQQPASSPAT